MVHTDTGASSEAPLLSPPPPVPGSWDRPAKQISGAWSMQAPERSPASVHRQPSLSDSERDMYSEALSPWLHATPEYHGTTLPEWHDSSTDTIVEEASEPEAPSPELNAPSSEPVTDLTDNVPGYRYTSIIQSTIPEESFEMSRSQSDLEPAAEAAASPELIGLGMSGTVAGFSARQAYLKELGYTFPTPTASAPAPAAPKSGLSYRMPPIEALRICKQDKNPARDASTAPSAENDASRATRALSGASFVFSPATAEAEAEQAWQPSPPPILRPRIPSVGEQETVVTHKAAPKHLPVRLPDTYTYSPPLQTIHIVRGSPPPWATPSPRTVTLELTETQPVAPKEPEAASVEPAPAKSESAAETQVEEPLAPASLAESPCPDEAPITHEPPVDADQGATSPENSDVYAAWAQDATLVGSSHTKLSSDDPKLKDVSVSSSWMAPPSDQETSALGLHIVEPLPTPREDPEVWQPVTDPAPASEEPRAPTPEHHEAPAPAPPITTVWPLRRPAPPEPTTRPPPSLQEYRVPSDARVVDAPYAATPRAVSYGTNVLDEAYESPADMPGQARDEPRSNTLPSRSYPAVPRKAPPPVVPNEPLPPPITGAAPALVSYMSTPTQKLRAPLDYSVPFPLLFQSRRHSRSSERAGRRLSSMDVPREAPPREDVRGRASLDEQRLPSLSAAWAWPGSDGPPDSQARPPVSQARPTDSQARPPDSQARPPVSQARPTDSQARPADSQARPPVSQARPADSQARPADSQARPPVTQARPPVTRARPPVSQAPALSPLIGSPQVPPTPPPKSWLAPATSAVPRASAAPSYARDYGVIQPALQPLQGVPIESKEGRHVWLDVDPDNSHLSMLGAVDDSNDSFHFESYFEHSLQRIRAELAQIGGEAPPRRSAAKAAAQEAARVAARAGTQRPPAAAPMDLTHNAPPVNVENVGSPLMSLDEFTYVMDENGVALSTPHLGLRSPSEPPVSTAPALPPLDTYLPEEHEVMGDQPPVAWIFHDEVRSAFADEPMPTDHRLPLEFVTKPNSVLSRGRPVKKTEQESIFYSSGPDVRRRRVGPPPSVPTWNFEEGDEEVLTSPRPAPAPAAAPRAASPPLLNDFTEPPVTESGRVEDDARKRRGREGADPKFASWWRRKGPSPAKATSAPPSDGPRPSEVSSEARTSTSTSTTMKYGRRTAPPGFEPSQPGKYFLAGTVSLPTLNIARTPEQRARHETGLAETEPSLIQSLLAAPSSSTVRARAGIVKALHFDEASAPPTGQVIVSEERKVLVRPVL